MAYSDLTVSFPLKFIFIYPFDNTEGSCILLYLTIISLHIAVYQYQITSAYFPINRQHTINIYEHNYIIHPSINIGRIEQAAL